MSEQTIPERETPEETAPSPEHPETPTERVMDMVSDIRRKAEDIGATAQERAKVLGETVSERTRDATEKIRFISEQARSKAATRFEGTSRFVSKQVGEAEQYSRDAIRRYPATAIALAVLVGLTVGALGRRIVTSMRRR